MLCRERPRRAALGRSRACLWSDAAACRNVTLDDARTWTEHAHRCACLFAAQLAGHTWIGSSQRVRLGLPSSRMRQQVPQVPCVQPGSLNSGDHAGTRPCRALLLECLRISSFDHPHLRSSPIYIAHAQRHDHRTHAHSAGFRAIHITDGRDARRRQPRRQTPRELRRPSASQK